MCNTIILNPKFSNDREVMTFLKQGPKYHPTSKIEWKECRKAIALYCFRTWHFLNNCRAAGRIIYVVLTEKSNDLSLDPERFKGIKIYFKQYNENHTFIRW